MWEPPWWGMLTTSHLCHCYSFFSNHFGQFASCLLTMNLRSHTSAAFSTVSSPGADDGVSQLMCVSAIISQSLSVARAGANQVGGKRQYESMVRNDDNDVATDAAAAAGLGGDAGVGAEVGLSVGIGAAAGAGANAGGVNNKNVFVRRIRSKESDGGGDAVGGDDFDDDDNVDDGESDTSEGWVDNVCEQGICELPCEGDECGCSCHH